nr:cell division protein ZapA [Thiocystis violacea]
MQVSIRILEKDYRIACEFHEQDDLRASARLLDSRMREIRQSGRVIGTDRIAVMAALNIANDLIQMQRARSSPEGDSNRRLRQLQERVNSALAGDPVEVPASPESDARNQPPLDASSERV